MAADREYPDVRLVLRVEADPRAPPVFFPARYASGQTAAAAGAGPLHSGGNAPSGPQLPSRRPGAAPPAPRHFR
jgi:hypothetical protein